MVTEGVPHNDSAFLCTHIHTRTRAHVQTHMHASKLYIRDIIEKCLEIVKLCHKTHNVPVGLKASMCSLLVSLETASFRSPVHRPLSSKQDNIPTNSILSMHFMFRNAISSCHFDRTLPDVAGVRQNTKCLGDTRVSMFDLFYTQGNKIQ